MMNISDQRSAISDRVRRRLTLLCIPLVAGACDLSVSQEDELGDSYAASIEEQLPILRDSAADAWLTTLGARLTSVADRESRDWHFYIVDDSTVNAFAVPGGHVFVHRGLIERAGTYSELAGVLGHEVAHVTLRHSVDQMKSRTKTSVVVMVVCAVINICGSTAAQVAIDFGGQALFAKYSRDDEAQADSAAIGYLVAAGIDPRGIPAMFGRMAADRQTDPTSLDSWFGSHPLEESRVARTNQLISSFGLPQLEALTSDVSSFAEFKASVRGLSAGR
jgi:predicted Zn-dependent protease